MRTTALIVANTDSAVARRLAALIAVWGVSARTMSLEAFLRLPARDPKLAATPLIAADFAALASPQDAEKLGARLSELHTDALLFGLSAVPGAGDRLAALSGGAFADVVACDGPSRVYEVGTGLPESTGPITGAKIHASAGPHDLALELGSGPAVETLVSVNDRPLFARAGIGTSRLYALATTDVLDTARRIDRLNEVSSFSLFAPVLMLLREVYGDALWHSSERFAALVIDDPPLQPSYGYLNYRRLSECMASDGFAATIAFVPYNHRRTRAGTARLVNAANGRLSLCVHGCDHVRGEFASRDAADLRAMVATGLSRMEAHRARRGTDYAHVMVFPGGRFSDEAMQTLAQAGFDAVVNSTPYPVEGASLLPAGAFLSPAVERYPGLPLLLRRYPVAATPFAIESFLGKPALIAAHPGDFKDRFGRIRHVVKRLNASAAPPEWTGLGEIVGRLYLERRRGDRTQVRAVFPRFAVTNECAETRRYTVFARDPAGTAESRTQWGASLPSRHLLGWRVVQLELEPHSSVALEIAVPAEKFAERVSYSFSDAVRAQARRGLWELRDRVLVRSDSLSGLARRVTGSL